jgi:hypothetical protein
MLRRFRTYLMLLAVQPVVDGIYFYPFSKQLRDMKVLSVQALGLILQTK